MKDILQMCKEAAYSIDDMERNIIDSSEQSALSAIAKPDILPEMLIDLSQNTSKKVRMAVAKHKNTPLHTKKRMSRDRDPDVAMAAKIQ